MTNVICRGMSLPEHHAILYRPDYCGLAHNYCRLGASNAELAQFFDVEPDDIATWIVNIPEFRAAVRGARGVARAKVWRGLYQRAVGYTCELERTEIHRGELKTLTRTVHYAPDPRAGIYWLEHEEGGGEDTPGDGQGNRRRLALCRRLHQRPRRPANRALPACPRGAKSNRKLSSSRGHAQTDFSAGNPARSEGCRLLPAWRATSNGIRDMSASAHDPDAGLGVTARTRATEARDLYSA